MPDSMLKLCSLVKEDGTLELSLEEVPIPSPAEDEVLVRVEATPINPSDMFMLFGFANMKSARQGGTKDRPTITADIPQAMLAGQATRIGIPLTVGNEGAGTVVAAGSSEAAQALVGKVVAATPTNIYAQYRVVKAADCLTFADDVTPAEAAAWFINPMTVLAMLETMRMEGHSAIVHTAAASNLGQMLLKACAADGIELINIVRKPEQVELLRDLGAKYVVNSSSDDFRAELTSAIVETGATLAFDAIGGGEIAGDILACMEAALIAKGAPLTPYGSDTLKQVYIYGALQMTPTQFTRTFGFAWSIGGWLVSSILRRLSPQRVLELRQRVANEIKTTFASHYCDQISFHDLLTVETVQRIDSRATGQKFLVTPNV